MRLSSFLLISSVCLAACSTAATQDESGGHTSGPGTESSNTHEPGMTSGGPSNTTDSPTTGLSTTGDGTGLPVTSTTSTSSDSASETTFASDGSSTDVLDTTEGTTGSTTGSPGGGPCEVDADCKLHDDCCSCYAIPVDQEDEVCDLLCVQSKCSELGIEKAVCRSGQCTTEKIDCSTPVLCDSLPPECPPGTLPGVAGGCWSGACVPVEACDKVPSCDLCPDSTLCVENQAFVSEFTCAPRPAACGDKVNCECAGEACVDPFNLCNEGAGEVDLVCACPNC